MPAPKVAVILATYFAENYLGDCFSSLRETDYPKEALTIIIVENDSKDATRAMLKEQQQHWGGRLVLLYQPENTGFARGNNIGMKWARDHGFEWAILLNQDTVVDPQWINRLMEAAASDERIAAVQAMLLLWPKEIRQINSRGNVIHYLGFGYSLGYRESAMDNNNNDVRDIVYASGAAVIYKLSIVWDLLEGFDEMLFMYHEDLDLGWRITLLGYRNVVASAARVWHKYDFRPTSRKYYWMERNRLIVVLKNYHWLTLFLLLPTYVVMEIGIMHFAFLKGWWRAKIQGWWFIIKDIPAIMENRWKVQSSRLVGDREVTTRFVGTIFYQEIANPLLTNVANPFFNTLWKMYRWIIRW